MVLTGFRASRTQDPAGLLTGDVALHPRGLVIAVLTGKTKHSVHNTSNRASLESHEFSLQVPSVCPARPGRARSVPL
ncbi:hypothetical protein ACFUNF_41980 [Streptomyces sp. NPDC057291]|uniref:hypothetical protein n=1 Tax=Streptomyces sp. NPDC057291 TaxID=3346087 RepID=UPI00363911D6